MGITPKPIVFPSSAPNNIKKYIENITKYTKGELSNKKKSIEKILQVENRWNKFNDTYNKRYIEYIKITVILVFSIICIWLCFIIDDNLILPEGFTTFIITIILGITTSWIYYIYQNILIHNLLVYDQIDYQAPVNATTRPTGTPGPSDTPEKTSCPICPANYVYDGKYCVIDILPKSS